MVAIDTWLEDLEKIETRPWYEASDPVPHKPQVMVKEYMQKITITIYPDGREFVKTNIWSLSKGPKQPKAKAKAKETMDKVEVQDEEVY